MFTGIIEEKGKIIRVVKGRVQKVDVESALDCKLGDSIAIQGICLTVINRARSGFTVEAMEQTKGATTLSSWKAGDRVNLERALKLGDRLGGHIMLGHIDEVGKLIRIASNNYYFKISSTGAEYLAPKGSVGIDGVSLTVSSKTRNIFAVSLIPFTLKNTTLGGLRIGSFVNLEYDYLAKILKNRHSF